MLSALARRKFQIPYYSGGSSLPIGKDSPWLAPLAGYSDLPFRMLCRGLGAAVCETEMVSAKGLYFEAAATADLLTGCPQDQPLIVQLFGGEKEPLRASVRVLKAHGYINFDFNMGCPVRKVFRQKAGAWLLGEPETALELAKAILKETGRDDGPLKCRAGFKLRLGVSPDSSPLPDLALRLEEAGAAWISLHPRYASQGYSGRADWEKLARLAERLSIPLIASGDLTDARAGLRCLDLTGAAGVMYARGALRNPAVFRDHKLLLAGGEPPEPSARDTAAVLLLHLGCAKAHGGDSRAFRKLRSIVPRYLRLFRGSQELRKKLASCKDWDGLENLIRGAIDMGEKE